MGKTLRNGFLKFMELTHFLPSAFTLGECSHHKFVTGVWLQSIVREAVIHLKFE